jgi:hypothetical protein
MNARNIVLVLLILGVAFIFPGCAAMDSYYSSHDPYGDNDAGPAYGRRTYGGVAYSPTWGSYYGYQGANADMMYDFGPRRGD